MRAVFWLGVIVFTVLVSGCVPTVNSEASSGPQTHVPQGMVWIPPGRYQVGSDKGLADERPAHVVKLRGFYMDATDVTNAEFEVFVKATGYKTVAEHAPDGKDFPTVPPSKLKPGALVFIAGRGWEYIAGANWMHPEGPGSNIDDRLDHPVVCVAWDDAVAYAVWAGKRLPTEAEWESAAGGGADEPYIWGTAELDSAHPQANVWEGQFPAKNLNTDGFMATSPVRSFKPNKFGLYDMAGNVWQWCTDWYRPDAYAMATDDGKGPSNSFDPQEPGVSKRVLRGGSVLCADCYCRGYRLTARMKTSPDTGSVHVGFRCVQDGPVSAPVN